MPSFQLPISTDTVAIVPSGYEFFADFTWNWLGWASTITTPPQAKINLFMVNNKRRIPSVKVFKDL